MGFMKKPIILGRKLMLFVVVLPVLLGHQPAFADNQDIAQLREAAEQGDAEAQFNLGIVYDFGRGVPEDKLEAVKWYQKAAEQEHADAQVLLSRLYYLGQRVPKNYEEAFEWARRAAEQGNADAQQVIGDMYRKGEGVPEITRKR